VITMPDLSQIVRRRPTVYTIPAGSSVDYSGAFNMLDTFEPGTYLFAYHFGDHPLGIEHTDSFELIKDVAPLGKDGAPPVAAARVTTPRVAASRVAASRGPSAGASLAERAVAALGAEEWMAVPAGADAEAVRAAAKDAEGEEDREEDREDGEAKTTEGGALPVSTALLPAYPNPFNPVAVVPFTVAEAGEVRLAVYDLLGREVARLVGAHTEAGAHTARFDASHLASGTYLVRMTAPGGFVQTQRLTLLK